MGTQVLQDYLRLLGDSYLTLQWYINFLLLFWQNLYLTKLWFWFGIINQWQFWVSPTHHLGWGSGAEYMHKLASHILLNFMWSSHAPHHLSFKIFNAKVFLSFLGMLPIHFGLNIQCFPTKITQFFKHHQRRATNLPLSKASLKGPLSSSHLNIWSFLPKVCLQLKHRNSSMKTTLEGAKDLTNSLCGVSSKAFEFSRTKIDLEPKWPVFLEVNPSKHGLFEQKQGSFGFQGYIWTLPIVLPDQAPDHSSPVVLQQRRPHRLPGIRNLRAFSEGVPSWRLTRKVGEFLSKLNHPKWKISVWMGFSKYLVNDLQAQSFMYRSTFTGDSLEDFWNSIVKDVGKREFPVLC